MRAHGRRAVCVSNLRQIGMAVRMYSDDTRGLLPPVRVTGTGVMTGWPYYIQPYMVGSGTPKITSWKPFVITGVMRCPANNIEETGVNLPEWSYKMNDNLRTKLSTDPNEASLPFSKVNRPTRTLLIADGRAPGQSGNTRFDFASTSKETGSSFVGGLTIAYPHNEKANCLFVDGHVESLTNATLENDWDNYHLYYR